MVTYAFANTYLKIKYLIRSKVQYVGVQKNNNTKCFNGLYNFGASLVVQSIFFVLSQLQITLMHMEKLDCDGYTWKTV